MRILYLNLETGAAQTEHALRNRGNNAVISVNATAEALERIRDEMFDAVVIPARVSQVLDFILNAHRIRPGLPLVVATAWMPAV